MPDRQRQMKEAVRAVAKGRAQPALQRDMQKLKHSEVQLLDRWDHFELQDLADRSRELRGTWGSQVRTPKALKDAIRDEVDLRQSDGPDAVQRALDVFRHAANRQTDRTSLSEARPTRPEPIRDTKGAIQELGKVRRQSLRPIETKPKTMIQKSLAKRPPAEQPPATKSKPLSLFSLLRSRRDK